MQINNSVNTDQIIDQAVQQAMESLGLEAIQIKQHYYQAIQVELNKISLFYASNSRRKNIKRGNRLLNPYAPEFGFDQSAEIAYEITKNKKDQAKAYVSINKILSYLRQGQEINYALYIKNLDGSIYRYEVPEEEISSFASIVQGTSFKLDADLRQYSEIAIERLENAKKFSDHVNSYMVALQEAEALAKKENSKFRIKQADRYEAFEYHYQKIDKRNKNENFSHSFNIEGIKNWLLARGHDTVGWFARGDIGLTSVKSVNLNNKFLFLDLASQKSLNEVYQLLKEIFGSNTLNSQQVSRLVKAFTPAVHDLKAGLNTNINKIVEDLINSLIK